MQLRLLHATSCLSIYHDACNNWLFLDWSGNLTLAAVQEACVTVAQCYLQQSYSRVLSSNLQVTGSSKHVATWLGIEFLPYLAATGVKHVASISTASLLSRNMGKTVRQWVPELMLNFFNTTEEAIAWLQQPHATQTEGYPLGQWPAATQSIQGMQLLRQRVQQRRQQVIKQRSQSQLA